MGLFHVPSKKKCNNNRITQGVAVALDRKSLFPMQPRAELGEAFEKPRRLFERPRYRPRSIADFEFISCLVVTCYEFLGQLARKMI
jgi:hypothetical protein